MADKIFPLRLNPEVHQALKVAAAKAGVTMQAIITLAVEKYVGMATPSLEEIADGGGK